MSRTGWHPRGEPTWPEFREAVPGQTRVEHVGSGRTGTFERWPRTSPARKNPGYAVVRWDAHGRMPEATGRVVAYAFNLREVAS